MRRAIFNADDFGGDSAINEAVEEAFCSGVLTSASLMISGAGAADAIRRAKRNPELKIGLHLAVVDAVAISPPDEIVSLIGPDGALRADMIALSVDIGFSRRSQQHLRREMTAQFQAFAAAGLHLDHVNAHRHMQLHPAVLELILEIGAEHGKPALRFPVEPVGPVLAADASTKFSRGSTMLRHWAIRMRAHARGRGFVTNDWAFGNAWSGSFNEARLLSLLTALPAGTSELYFHPAMRPCPFNHATEAEFEALLSRPVKRKIESQLIERTNYSALKAAQAR